MYRVIKYISLMVSGFFAITLIYSGMYMLIKPPITTERHKSVENSVFAGGFMFFNNKDDDGTFVYTFIRDIPKLYPFNSACLCASFFNPVTFKLNLLNEYKAHHNYSLSRSDIFTDNSMIMSNKPDKVLNFKASG